MIYTKPINFTSIEDIQKNISSYKEKFYEDGILVFRDANLDLEEQKKLMFIFGKELNFYPNEPSHILDVYTENHSRSSMLKDLNKDEPVIAWHIENAFFDNPVVIAFWNMQLFKSEKGTGNTWFVDSIKLLEFLSEDEQLFLESSIIRHSNKVLEQKNQNKDFDNFIKENIPYINKTLKKHWVLNKNVIRMYFDEPGESLYSIKGEKPTKEENERYIKLKEKMTEEIKNNTEIRIIHEWKEGDIVIPDLHRMIHTVAGGFKPSEREFIGIWGYSEDTEKKKRFDIQKRLSVNYPF